MKVYLSKDANQNYYIGKWEEDINGLKPYLKGRKEVLVDFYNTEHKLVETMLNILWRKYEQDNRLQLPLIEAITFRSTCKRLEQVI